MLSFDDTRYRNCRLLQFTRAQNGRTAAVPSQKFRNRSNSGLSQLLRMKLAPVADGGTHGHETWIGLLVVDQFLRGSASAPQFIGRELREGQLQLRLVFTRAETVAEPE